MNTLVNQDPFMNLHNNVMIYHCFQIFSLTKHYILLSFVELSEAE